MGTGESRLDELGEMNFRGRVGKTIAQYAKGQQRFAHDMAAALDQHAELAHKAMLKLHGHPRLKGVNVRVRARLVARHLKRGRDLAQGISAEVVRFNLQYRREFLDIDQHQDRKRRWRGEVDL